MQLKLGEIKPESATYRLLEPLGEGLSASVYKAERIDSRALSRQIVALKILKNQNSVHHLRREFETLARVQSDHCVRVLSWENIGEHFALALEWIDGVSLFELARHQSLPEELIVEVVAQCLKGLESLSLCGLWHGDLHPRNILVDVNGLVRLVDFSTVPQAEAVLIGAPAYLAPEVWQGGQTDSASDLFALGLVAHDLRTDFLQIPRDTQQARARAIALASCENDLLALQPQQRWQAGKVQTSLQRQKELAARVRECQFAKRQTVATVAIDPQTPTLSSKVLTSATVPPAPLRANAHGRSFRFSLALPSAVVYATALLISSLPVNAFAPMNSYLKTDCQIEIRSQNWLRVAINGHDLGFAPIVGVLLKPGQHLLHWEGAKGKGERQFTLRPGQSVRLQESDLAKLTWSNLH